MPFTRSVTAVAGRQHKDRPSVSLQVDSYTTQVSCRDIHMGKTMAMKHPDVKKLAGRVKAG